MLILIPLDSPPVFEWGPAQRAMDVRSRLIDKGALFTIRLGQLEAHDDEKRESSLLSSTYWRLEMGQLLVSRRALELFVCCLSFIHRSQKPLSEVLDPKTKTTAPETVSGGLAMVWVARAVTTLLCPVHRPTLQKPVHPFPAMANCIFCLLGRFAI